MEETNSQNAPNVKMEHQLIFNQLFNSIGDEFTKLLYSPHQQVDDVLFNRVTELIKIEGDRTAIEKIFPRRSSQSTSTLQLSSQVQQQQRAAIDPAEEDKTIVYAQRSVAQQSVFGDICNSSASGEKSLQISTVNQDTDEELPIESPIHDSASAQGVGKRKLTSHSDGQRSNLAKKMKTKSEVDAGETEPTQGSRLSAVKFQPKRSSTISGSYQCDGCQIPFNTRVELGRHKNFNTKNQPHRCVLCDYSSNLKCQVDKHVTENHPPLYRCSFCKTKESNILDEILNHMRNDHKFNEADISQLLECGIVPENL